MESGIDIKFPFCALAAAKLPKGAEGITIEEIPMMSAVRARTPYKCRTQRKTPFWALMSVHIQ